MTIAPIEIADTTSFGPVFDEALRLYCKANRPNSEFELARMAERLKETVLDREVFGWHYSRLLPNEIDNFRKFGARVSTKERFLDRLGEAEVSGHLSSKIAKKIRDSSYFSGVDSPATRVGKFWMIGTRLDPVYRGVGDFLRYWGGEVARKNSNDLDSMRLLSSLGRPCIILLRVPISDIRYVDRIVRAMIDIRLGLGLSALDPDFYIERDLPPEAILDVIDLNRETGSDVKKV